MADGVVVGGRSHPGAVFRRGNTVVRPAGTVESVELLRQVGEVFDGAPRVLGLGADGTVSLMWLDGEAFDSLAGPPLSHLETVAGVGALLRRLHDATAPLAAYAPAPKTGLGDPSGVVEVVCHGDPLPGSVVCRDHIPVALIDWEHAAPGRRAWDLAVGVRWWAPLRAPENLRGGEQNLDHMVRARAFLDGYSADRRLRIETAELLLDSQHVAALNALSVARARGEHEYRRWMENGGERRLAADQAWLSEQIVAILADLL